MFEEFVGSQLLTHLSIQAKNEAESPLIRLTDALEPNSEELKLPHSNPLKQCRLKQYISGRKRNNQTLNVDMADITTNTLDEYYCTSNSRVTRSENRLNYKHTSPLREVLQWPNIIKRKFWRCTERMPFVITHKVWKALFQDKKYKKTEKHLAKLERKMKRKEQK